MPGEEKKNNFLSQFLKILLIFIVAGAISAGFILTRPKPSKKKINLYPSTVGVVPVQLAKGHVWIDAMGVVQPTQELKIISEVGGRVEWINSKLIPGGYIKKGEVIAKIEKTDYEIAIEQAKANLATARKNLLVEEGAARSAKVMEDMSKIESTRQARELRMRVPYIQAAKANLVAAEKLLEQAKKDLQRTSIIAPFSIIVESEDIEIGNYVTRLSTIAQAVGTAAYWVKVTLPVSKIYYIDLPGVNAQQGSEAEIIFKSTSGRQSVKRGRVVRLFGSLDSLGRMAKVLIEVDDPLGLENGKMEDMLLLNSYVKVRIKGKKLDGMIELPREYLREGDVVWVADKADRLVIKKVVIAWRDRENVYISSGLNGEDRIITSSNFIPVAGMKLSVIQEKQGGGDE